MIIVGIPGHGSPLQELGIEPDQVLGVVAPPPRLPRMQELLFKATLPRNSPLRAAPPRLNSASSDEVVEAAMSSSGSQSQALDIQHAVALKKQASLPPIPGAVAGPKKQTKRSGAAGSVDPPVPGLGTAAADLKDLPMHGISQKQYISRLRVLVVEDNPVNMKLAMQYLKRIKVRSVRNAADGMEAVRAMAEGRADIAFLDLYMPVADGFEAATRARDPDLVPPLNVPVMVAMTASVREQDRRRAADVGMVEYVNKPAKKEDFVRAMVAVRPRVEEMARKRLAAKAEADLMTGSLPPAGLAIAHQGSSATTGSGGGVDVSIAMDQLSSSGMSDGQAAGPGGGDGDGDGEVGIGEAAADGEAGTAAALDPPKRQKRRVVKRKNKKA